MENNKIPSEDENKALENAKAFAEEAKYDIEAADKLLKNLDLNNCENDDRVFYLGRRSFFFLQQAVEKISKAYAFLLQLWFLKILSSPHIPQDKKDIFRRLLKELSPKRISHLPHTTILYVFSKSFMFSKEREFKVYLEYIEKEIKNLLSEFFKEIKLSGEIIFILNDAVSTAFEKCYIDLFENLKFKPLEEGIYERCKIITEKYEKNKKHLVNLFPHSPPNISETVEPLFDSIEKLKNKLRKDIKTPFKDKKHRFFANTFRRPYLEADILLQNNKIAHSKIKLNGDKQIEFISIFRNLPDFIYCVFCFKFVLPAYLIIMSSYLAWYEDGGRYPNVNHFNKDSICKDIKKIKLVYRKIKSTLDIINDTINWKEKSFKEEWLAKMVPLALF
jgi:hypothetical protein